MTGFWVVSVNGRVLRAIADGSDSQLRAKTAAGNTPNARYEFVQGEMPEQGLELEDFAAEYLERYLDAQATAFLEAHGVDEIPEETTRVEKRSSIRLRAIGDMGTN